MASTSSAGHWPPAVREWVAKCLGMMNDSNREAASAELKKAIKDAHAKNELSTIDWSKVELESDSLKSSNKQPLKRKIDGPEDHLNKKLKKPNISGAPLDNQGVKPSDRFARFAREHEIERQKQLGSYKPKNGQEYDRHVNAPSSLAVNREPYKINSWDQSAATSSYHHRRKFLNPGGTADEEDTPVYDANVIDWDKYTIVGRSTKLWKRYLRITSEPDLDKIRPLEILRKTLAELSRQWKQNPNYPWTCDQLKSLRQDLTVQRIKNAFTVQVYEIHARMALESADLVEYNQCQATLRHLYDLGLPGNKDEFLAYRILYLTYTRNRSDLNMLIATLTPEQKQQIFVRQALDVQTALSTSNYHALFVLFTNAYNMGGYILDHLLERERVGALVIMTKAYHRLPISFITSELAFESSSAAVQFLYANDAGFFLKPTTSSKNDTPPDPNPSQAAGGDTRGNGSSSLLNRLGKLTTDAEVEADDDDKILDCRPAHPPLVECLANKHSRVGIKGQI
ncbi:hypothetical protein BS47DRAFT_1184399 [Hydnum rufescens UP504]|uniref:SAC3/GANP/THP3 conserved domain-containing protein n=1 Tax=Hydnum rufescens UP504 TaxID=1448309 RepID=A0A9P6ATX6_9AGAM|nr:hypothetical protein BS47DRAFT_1184399 [Hydnum rufescens UP504]